MNFNRVLLGGNMTRDPQLRFLPSQTAICEFGVAVNEKWTDKNTGEQREKAAFVDCKAFGKLGEVINQYFTKGRPIFIEGKLDLEQWEDKNGGGKRSKLTVIVESFQFCSGDKGGQGGQQQHDAGGYDDAPGYGGPPAGTGRQNRDARQQQRRPAPGRAPTAAPVPAEAPFGDEQHFTDDDVPFLWEGRRTQPL